MIRSGPHLLGREHTKQADRTITHDDNGGSRRHIRRVGGEPAGAHHVGERQKASQKVGCRYLRRSHQGAIGERDTEYWRLRTADELLVHTRRRVAVAADRAGVVRSKE